MTACLFCGHQHEAHRHYREGQDCSRCDCERFRRSYRWLSPTGLLLVAFLVAAGVVGQAIAR